AKARLTQILNVKKDGELVGGTDTQKTVARAQEQLDNNDIQGAIATLQALDGDAKEKAQPLIEQAQATVLAEQIQNMLRQMIVASVGTDIGTAAGQGLNGAGNALSEALGDSGGAIQNMIPGQQGVVRDEESGFSILPPQRGFKGFSPGSAE
ncbi:MAG: hypothetical protein WCY59_00100, partial [Anaerovoracaceae bacterium]